MRTPGVVAASLLLSCLLGCGKARGTRSAEEVIREKVRKARCASNLRTIVNACFFFSEDNEGKLPATLESLSPKHLDRTAFSCRGKRGEMDYVYVHGLKPGDPPDCVLAYDKEGNHEDGRNVLFLGRKVNWRFGGKVEWVAEDEFRKALEKTREHLKAGRGTPATKPGGRKARGTRSAEEELKELAIRFYTAATFDDWSSCLDPDSAKMFSRAAWEKSERPAMKREDIKITKVEITGDAAVIHCESPTGKRGVMRSLWAAKKDGKWLLTFGKAKAPLHKSRLGTARERARRSHCASNLKQIAYACRQFPKDNKKRFPATLEALFPKHIPDRAVFSCPSKRGEMDYAYVEGPKPGDPPDCVLAYDNEGNHEGGRNVLFVDGNVKWMTEEEFKKALEKTQIHLKGGGSTTR